MPPLPIDVARFLADQHAVGSRRQLARLAAGGAAQVDDWVRGGHLRAVHRGVVAVPGSPATPEQAILAAVLRCGDGARAGPVASLALLRIEGFTLRAARAAPDVLVPRSRAVTGVPFRVRRTSVPRTDRLSVSQIPALSATRALIEAAAPLDERTLRVALDSARRQRLLSIELLASRAKALPSHPGAAVVRRLLDAGQLSAESEGERELLPLLSGFDPPPQCQVSDLVPGRRLDFAWPALRYALEYDGRDHHVLPTDRDHDGLRDLECAEAGVLVHRITAGMLAEAPEATLRGIRHTFERRKRAFGLSA